MSHTLSKVDANQVAKGRAMYDSALISGTIHRLSLRDLESVVISLLYSLLQLIRLRPEDRKPLLRSEWLLLAKKKVSLIYATLNELAEKELPQASGDVHITNDVPFSSDLAPGNRLDSTQQPSNVAPKEFELRNRGARLVLSFYCNHFIERYFSPLCDLNHKVSPCKIKASNNESRTRDRHNGLRKSFKGLTI